ncbi:MAG TPA: XRE family transcriptional regulator [Bryobacteraceae bacterium]|nr:XRE family transcriptional regulator [Bryobacteraceae bacterium]
MTSFNPDMLTLAREFRGLTQTELAENIGVKQAFISKLESGLQSPDSALEDISHVLRFPTDFFRQEDRIFGFNSAVFFHRKRQALPDRLLRKLHAAMNIARMRVYRLTRSSQQDDHHFSFRKIDPSTYKHGAVDVADVAKAMWHVPAGPVRNVMEIIEAAGGVIVPMDFGTLQADAISEWIPGYPPIFLTNTNIGITGDRLRLTLTHETGHVLMHDYPDPDIENQANQFAAEFLMPRKHIKASLYNLTLAKLAQLKRIWKVSMAALIQRAHELKTITDNQRRYLFMALSKRGNRLREPAETDIQIERSVRLRSLVKSHVDMGFSTRDLMGMLFVSDENEFKSTYLGLNQLSLVG